MDDSEEEDKDQLQTAAPSTFEEQGNSGEDYRKYSNLFVFAGGNKAGMEAMDKEKQAEVIYEMSKNSSFFKRAKQLGEEADRKAEQLQKEFDQLTGAALRKMESAAQTKLMECEKRRSFEKICCVLDMDMFYAAVEIRDRPELKDLPVAVGGSAMISTSNYVARKYGVRAAMPGFIAKKLCPNLVFVHCNFDKYRIVAEQIRGIIGKVDPQYRSHSLDEVYFELTTAAKARFRELTVENPDRTPTIEELRVLAVQILQEVRSEIKTITNGLTCSAGIANNFFLAKICADVNKPDGQFELPARREEVMNFLTTLPTRKVGGIGKVMEKILQKLGMNTVGEIRPFIPHILHSFKPASSEFLTRVSIGIADNEGKEILPTIPDGAVTRKSIGCERTYSAKGISEPHELYQRLHEICERVHADMVRENLRGKAVTVKVKDINFHLHTKCQSSATWIQSCESIETIAKAILDSFLPIRLRLLGVQVTKFDKAYDPQRADKGQTRLQHAMSSFLQQSRSNGDASHRRIEKGDQNSCPPSDGCTRESFDAVDLVDEGEEEDENEDGEEHQQPDDESFEGFTDRDMTFFPSVDDGPREMAGASPHSMDGHMVEDIVDLLSDSDAEDARTGADPIAECPVCGDKLSGDVMAINVHIDRCLTVGAESKKRKHFLTLSNEPIDISDHSSSATLNGKRPARNIEMYFARK
jgi:DNA polymerase kappa